MLQKMKFNELVEIVRVKYLIKYKLINLVKINFTAHIMQIKD